VTTQFDNLGSRLFIGLDGKIGIFNFQGAGTNGNDVPFVRACRLLYHYRTQKSIDFGKIVAFLGHLFYCSISVIFAQQGIITLHQSSYILITRLTERFQAE